MHGDPCQREQDVLTLNPNDRNLAQKLIKTATDVSQMLGTLGFPINW